MLNYIFIFAVVIFSGLTALTGESVGSGASAVATCPNNEDANHPTYFSGITWLGTGGDDYKLWIDRPAIG